VIGEGSGARASAGPGSHRLVLLLLVGAAVVALLTLAVARSRRVQLMRADLAEVLTACRARYDAGRSADDTAAADAWQPPLQGVRRPHDPACGSYRRRNMLAGGP
jgi:Flp pilus assembly protein TadB